MRMTISELRKFLRESMKELTEDVVPNDDDEIDLGDPTIVWNNSYDLNDQETSTKVAHHSINFNPEKDEEMNALVGDALTLYQIASSMNENAPMGWEKTVSKMKKDMKKGKKIDSPFALANWMKKQGYKPKP